MSTPLADIEENAMEEEIPERISESCKGSDFTAIFTFWVSMNSESCVMYLGQFLLKPTLKECRRVPIMSSLSIFFFFLARSVAERAIVSKRRERAW